MNQAPQRERLIREKIVCWLMDSLYLFFAIFLIPLLLPWSFPPIIRHPSFFSSPAYVSTLLSIPLFFFFFFYTTYFSPPLSVIGKGWCTRIHLIMWTRRTQTRPSEQTFLVRRGNKCTCGPNPESSLTGLTLSRGCGSRKRERQTNGNKMKVLKWNREINYPVCLLMLSL